MDSGVVSSGTGLLVQSEQLSSGESYTSLCVGRDFVFIGMREGESLSLGTAGKMCLAAPSPLFVFRLHRTLPSPKTEIKSLLRHVRKKKRAFVTRDMAQTAQTMVLGSWKQHRAPPGGSQTHCARSVCFIPTFVFGLDLASLDFLLVLTWLVSTFFFAAFFGRGCEVKSPTSKTVLFALPLSFLHFLQTGVLSSCIAFFFFSFPVRETSTKLYEYNYCKPSFSCRSHCVVLRAFLPATCAAAGETYM